MTEVPEFPAGSGEPPSGAAGGGRRTPRKPRPASAERSRKGRGAAGGVAADDEEVPAAEPAPAAEPQPDDEEVPPDEPVPAAAAGVETEVAEPGAGAEQGAAQAEEFRLADGVEILRTERGIAVVNVAVGSLRELPYEVVGLLAKLLDWTTPAAVLRAAVDDGSGSLVAGVDLLTGLAEIRALQSRREDLSGVRLRPPGPGWRSAETFIRETRTTRATGFVVPEEFAEALASKAAVYRQPSAFHERVDAPFLPLSNPLTAAPTARPFEQVLFGRRTSRRFAAEPCSEPDLSRLLFHSWGMTAQVPNALGDYFLRKTSPGGGALHSVEAYPIVLNVAGVEPGSYHYSVRRHGLERVSDVAPSEWIVPACGDQEWVAEAGVVVLCVALLPRMAWKYDFSRSFRAVMAETGFTSQTAFLVSAWLGLGCFTTLALRDEIVEDVLGLDPAKQTVLLATGAGTLESEVLDWSRPRVEGQQAAQSL